MKKFFTIFFITLGVIFFLLILAVTLFFIIDPYNIKPLLKGVAAVEMQQDAQKNTTNTETGQSENVDKNPVLNESQEKVLETFGVDPAAVPSSITPQQEACFIQILGQARVLEIKAGGVPTATEYFKAKGCL